MRTITLFLATLLLAVGFAALAPVAQAKPYCTASEYDCPGFICLYRPTLTCVGDECWFHCWGPAGESSSPSVGAAGAAFPCMDIYNRWDVGPATVEQRSSCEYRVYLFGEPVLV